MINVVLKTMRIFRTFAFPFFAFPLLGLGSAHAGQDMDCLISAKGVGPVKLGMTLRQTKQAFPQAEFTRTEDGDGVALVGVRFANADWMILYAGEEDPGAAINWARKIEFIETTYSACKMENGVGPGMLVKDAEKQLGKVQKITQSEIESREYVDFTNQPKHFQFRLDYTGIFPEGLRITKKFKPAAKILSIAVVPERK